MIHINDFLSPEELEKYEDRQEAQSLADLEEVQETLEEEPVTKIPAVNFRITDDELGQGTPKEKFRANIMAIQLLKKCENENRHATPEEQAVLSRFVGWGGLADAFDETKSAWNIAEANDRSDQERITQLMDDARKEVEIYPDRNVGMSALHGYGYFADDMYPLGKEQALDLHRRGLKVYCLQTDGSKSEYASREMIQEHEGLFGVERREWDALEADEPDYTEEFDSLRDPMIIVNKEEALKYYDAGATIYLITPFSQPIAASERTEIERGSDYFQLPEDEQTLLKDLEAEMKEHPQMQSLKEASAVCPTLPVSFEFWFL